VNGAIKPIYRDFQLTELNGGAWKEFRLPVLAGKASMAINAGSIANWNVQASAEDTLDAYFHHRLNIKGYPRQSGEESLLQGEQTLLIQALYTTSLMRFDEVSWWVFRPRELYLTLGSQIGWVDNKNQRHWLYNKDDAWENGVRGSSIELRLRNDIFYMQQSYFYLEWQRAWDTVYNDNGIIYTPQNIWTEGLMGKISPTRLRLGMEIWWNSELLGWSSEKTQIKNIFY
jgi:hypothetical protein